MQNQVSNTERLYPINTQSNTFRYAVVGALVGSAVSAAAIVLWSNPATRKRVSQTVKDTGAELKSNVFSETNKRLLVDAIVKTIDELRIGVKELIGPTPKRFPD